MLDIVFVTVNYNTLDRVRALSEFFAGLEVPFTFQFVVVDNNSSDGSREFLRAQPNLVYIQAETNLGYGRAINRGIAATKSKHVCVMNSDVVLNREALIKLWQFMEANDSADLCAPRLVYEDGRHQGMVFNASLFSQYALWFARLQAWRVKSSVARARSPVRVDGVLGAFFLMRRSAMPQPTLFDEDFFFFYEDSALAHTLKNGGKACFVIPDARIVHVGGQSRTDSSIQFFYRGRYLYLQKFYGRLHARLIYGLDRSRIFRKWLLYSVFASLSNSERIRGKQQRYKAAWELGRWTP